MAKEPLLEEEIEAGAKLVEWFDKHEVRVVAALWFYFSDAEHWKLLIAIETTEKSAVAWYLKAQEANSGLDLAKLQFIPPDHTLLRGLSVVRVEGPSPVRMVNNAFDGVYVEDALIYRLSLPARRTPRKEPA